MSSQAYTIYKEYIDEELSWFPVTMPMTTTQAPTGFWEGLDTKIPHDNFIGNNTDPPDPEKWTILSGAPEISNNRLNIHPALGNPGLERVITKYTVSGDLDVEVEFELILYPSDTFWRWQLYLADGVRTHYCGRHYEGGGAGDSQKYRWYITGTSKNDHIVSSDTVGKLRFTRTGTIWNCYYWDSGWTAMGAPEDVGDAGDCTFYLGCAAYNNLNVNGYWDNFIINKGTVIWPDGRQYLSADDDFIGVDGSVPNTNLWSTFSPTPTIQGNKLRVSVDSGNTREGVQSLYTISGDFDLRVDYDIIAGPSTNGWYAGFRCSVGSNLFQMLRSYRTPTGQAYQSWYTGASWSQDSGTSDTNGKLRVTRIGSTIYGYYYNSGWVELDSWTIGSGDLTFAIYLDAFDLDPTVTIDYDNFTIVSSDKVLWDNYANRVYFTDTDDNKLYTEIETFNHATSAATYHTAVPTVSAGDNTPLTFNWDWEREYSVRELPATDFSDSFTGANGSAPDTTKWRNVGATTTIQNNKMNQVLGAGASNADANAISNFTVDGNFDVQVDYDLVTYPSTSYWGMFLYAYDTNNAGIEILRGWYGSQSYRTWQVGWRTTTGTGDTSGKLRITRVGNTWTSYFWGGSSWTQDWTYDATTDPTEVTFWLVINHGDTSPAVETNFDNFKFNNAIYNQAEVGDTFTGNDGDAPDIMKWNPGSRSTIQGNKLRNNATDGSVYFNSGRKWKLQGDFDIQADFDVIAGPNTNYWRSNLVASIDGQNFFNMRRGYNTANAHHYNFRSTVAGGTDQTPTGTSDSSGKLRLVRIGTTAYGYYWNGSSWTLLGSDTFPTGDVYVSIDLIIGVGNPDAIVDWDNFQVNGADSITGWTEDTGEFASSAVWDVNYKIVAHLAQEPTGSADDILDSTINEFHGRSYNMDSGNSGSNEFGKYITFNGSNEFIDFGDAFYSNELTMESVTNVTSFTGGQPRMIWLKRNIVGTSTTDSSNSEWACQYIDADTVNFQAWTQPGSGIVASDGIDSPTDLTGKELYYAGAFPAAALGPCYSYLNGEHGLGTYRGADDLADGPLGIQLGTRSNNNNSRWFLGNMREGRVSNIQRSHTWIKVTNLSLMGGLFDEPTIAGSSGSEVYTIDKDRIDEELTWFPTTLSLDFTGSPAPSANFWDYFDNIDLNANDDFTGNDGDEPNPLKWTEVGAPYIFAEIQNNKLNLGPINNDTGDQYVSAIHKAHLIDNFEIQVDFDLVSYPAASSWRFDLSISEKGPTNDWCYVGIEWNAGTRHYIAYVADSGATNYNVKETTSHTSGKLKIRKSGTTIQFFYWTGSDWNEVGTGHTWVGVTSSSEFNIKLVGATWDGLSSNAEANFDNFTVNYAADIKWDYSDRLYFEDSDSNRLYAEIEQFDSIANDFTYHFAVPTISAEDDTPITLNWDWEDRAYSTRNLTKTWASDDFTGTDGDPPDPLKWTDTDPDNVMSIQSNKLHFDGDGSGNKISYMISKFGLGGNFDVQVDFDLITWDHPTSAPNYVYIRLIEGSTYTYVGRQDVEGGAEDRMRLIGSGGTNESWDWSGTSGKFRFQKTGGSIYAYVWTGSQWEWDGNTNGIAISESYTNVKVFLYFEQETGGDVEATLDNFQINSADSIYLTDEVNDDFTGTNGDLPDVSKWYHIPGGTGFTIVGNKLRTVLGTESPQIVSRYQLGGDFDTQVDVDVLTGPNFSTWTLTLNVTIDDDNVYQLWRGYNTAHMFRSRRKIDGSWSTVSTYNSTATTDLYLRIYRTGDVFYFRAHDGTAERDLGSHDFGSDPSVEVRVQGYSSSPTYQGEFDNFQINGADSITGWTDETGEVPAQQVWDDNFQIVSHLHQEPTGSANDIKDSTVNDNHGTSYNMDSTNSSTNDIGCKSLTFDGVAEWVDYGDILDPGTGEYSVELFVKGNTNETLEMIIAKGNRGSEDAGWSIWQAEANLRARCGAGGAVQRASTSLAYGDLDPIWYSVALVLDHTDEKIYGYRDGSKDDWYQGGGGPTSDDITGFDIDTSDDLAVATARDNGTNYIYGKFEFSEIRISNTARTPAWIAATNLSLNGQIWLPLEGAVSWDLVIQDMAVATSAEQVALFAQLIIQNLNILTSADAIKIIPLLNINDLNINTPMGRMIFWEALSTINTSVAFRTLLRDLISRTSKRTITSKTLKRTLEQYNG